MATKLCSKLRQQQHQLFPAAGTFNTHTKREMEELEEVQTEREACHNKVIDFCVSASAAVGCLWLCISLFIIICCAAVISTAAVAKPHRCGCLSHPPDAPNLMAASLV